jgi:hypothetical protein
MRQFAFVLFLSVMVASCSQSNLTQTPASKAASDTPIPATAAKTEESTSEVTPTIYLPELDLIAIGDERELDSFILEITDVREFESPECLDQSKCTFFSTIGYIRDSSSMYRAEWSNYINEEVPYVYLLDGTLYRHIPAFFDYPPRNEIYFRPSEDLIDGFLDMSEFKHYPDTLWGSTFINSAQFLAQEVYEGIPANHFILDKTNLSAPVGEFVGEIQEADGDVYISQDGNYMLFLNLKLTGELGNRELTRKLTSINQIAEFTIPSDFPNAKLDLSFPLPEEGYLFSYDVNPGWGEGVSKFDVCLPSQLTDEDFLAFYQDLPETNGWVVSQLGHDLPGSVWYGLYDFVMARISKGEQNIYVYPVSYGLISPPSGCVFATAELHK